jgi:hypothetical protein
LLERPSSLCVARSSKHSQQGGLGLKRGHAVGQHDFYLGGVSDYQAMLARFCGQPCRLDLGHHLG